MRTKAVLRAPNPDLLYRQGREFVRSSGGGCPRVHQLLCDRSRAREGDFPHGGGHRLEPQYKIRRGPTTYARGIYARSWVNNASAHTQPPTQPLQGVRPDRLNALLPTFPAQLGSRQAAAPWLVEQGLWGETRAQGHNACRGVLCWSMSESPGGVDRAHSHEVLSSSLTSTLRLLLGVYGGIAGRQHSEQGAARRANAYALCFSPARALVVV